MVLVCLPLAAPIGLSPLHILTLCGSERVLVVSTEPLDRQSSGGGVPAVLCPIQRVNFLTATAATPHRVSLLPQVGTDAM